MKDTFATYHPVVNFTYFAFVFSFTMFFMHPICLTISLVCALAYLIYLRGKKAVLHNSLSLLPIVFITAIINPAFNHEGTTILSYLPSGNPLTLESIVYGIAAATMLMAIICWFSSYNEIMTSDKFIYIFGRIIPSFSLIISMALRFIPKFKAQIKEVSIAQKGIGRDISNGGIIKRTRHGITILSIMVSWMMENAIETADSMKSRGYGLKGRTAFSIYCFDKRDKTVLNRIIILGSYVFIGGISGGLSWRYFPNLQSDTSGMYTISILISYIGLCLMPIIVNGEEDRQWKATQLKI